MEKPTYASILRTPSNTDMQRNLSKQKIKETNNNTSRAQERQTNR